MLTRAAFADLCAKAVIDPQPLIEHCFWITTKGNPGEPPLAKLRFNRPQRKVHQAVLAARNAGQPPRIIELKARQTGGSTQGEGYVTATALTQPHTQSMIIAHLDETAEKLFRKVLMMAERMPPELRPRFPRPRKDEIRFDAMPCADGDAEMQSSILIGTASGKELWRGLTLRTLHASEFPLYPYQEETWVGMMQAVAATPESLILVEGTAQASGDYFHEQWLKAEAGESDFTPVFIPWFDREDAWMPTPQGFTLDADERDLKKAFGLTDEQLQWRRFMLYTQCGGNVDLFNREYPATATMAFLLAGRPCFPSKALQAMQDRSRREAKLERGEMTAERGFIPTERGSFAVYERPQRDHDYAVGGDPSAGVEGGDPACIQVFNRTTGHQVATWHGYIDPVGFARLMVRIGRWYNDAVLAPEIQNHGHAVIEELKHQMYPRLYQWQRVDKIQGALSNYLGWETNGRTKALLIDSMQSGLIDADLMIWDLLTLKELSEFQWIERGKAGGINYDDRAMAMLIAYRVHLETPMVSTGLPPKVSFPEEKKGEEADPAITGTSNVSKQVWADVEKDIAGMGKGTTGSWREWANADPEPTESEEPWEPLIPW